MTNREIRENEIKRKRKKGIYLQKWYIKNKKQKTKKRYTMMSDKKRVLR